MVSLIASVAVVTIAHMVSGFPTIMQAPAPWTQHCSDSPPVVHEFDFPFPTDSPATIVSRLVFKTKQARNSSQNLTDIATGKLNNSALLFVLDTKTYNNIPILDASELSNMGILQAYIRSFNSLSHVAALFEELLKNEKPEPTKYIKRVQPWTYRLLCEHNIEISNMGAIITDHVTHDVVESDRPVDENDEVPRYSRIYVVAKRSHDLFSALYNYYSTLHNKLSG